MPITVDGLVSGLDTTALINAIISGQVAQKATINSRIDDYQARSSKLSDLVGLLGDMEDSLTAIQDIADFSSYRASYLDNDFFSVEVDGDAVPGVYNIEVISLAQAAQLGSAGYASKTADLNYSGTFDLTYDGTTTSINVAATDSLTDIAASINDIDGLHAYVMNTGSGANPYKLIIQGEDSGSDYGITIDETGLGGDSFGFTTLTAASSAELEINGITVASDTNTVTDAIPGMTINLLGESAGDVISVEVEPDPDAIETKVKSFVSAYNAIVDHVNTNSVYNQEAGIRGPYVGETSVQRVLSGLREVVATSFDDLAQDYDALSLMGIELDSEGHLNIDSDRFQEVLAENPDQVSNFFTSDDGFVAAMVEKIDIYADPVDGTIEGRRDTLESRVSDMEDRVDSMDLRLERTVARLRRQFAGMESLLSGLQNSQQYLLGLIGTTTTA